MLMAEQTEAQSRNSRDSFAGAEVRDQKSDISKNKEL
jgi:hypothetical protein